jgi:hypothetical protein
MAEDLALEEDLLDLFDRNGPGRSCRGPRRGLYAVDQRPARSVCRLVSELRFAAT